MLKEQGFSISAQVLCYPFLDFTDAGGILGGEESSIMQEFFLPSGVDKREAHISPVNTICGPHSQNCAYAGEPCSAQVR